jgi:hypothetical protein
VQLERPKIQPGENMASHARTLYVVMQGEFALYRKRTEDPHHDTLHILAPQVQGHLYKAGPWLSDWMDHEYDLPSTPLVLHHAIGDRKQKAMAAKMIHHPRAIPERNLDALMGCGPAGSPGSGAAVHITAPVPLAILSGLAETARGATITFASHCGQVTRPASPHAATILILLYKWYDDRPYLADGSGRIWETGGSEHFQSIHLYASSRDESNETAQHAKDAFRAAAKLLGQDARIDWPDKSSFFRLPATPPAGLTWAQVNLFLSEVISLRGSRLLEEDFLDLRDAKLPFHWEPTRGGEFTNCGPVTGDDDGVDGD